ncbi:MAG: hypothetical protein CMJ78_00465 [Planctomycetaceae bacterium]|nr:hypothetical protein [Planctomycetaceae bacterium]
MNAFGLGELGSGWIGLQESFLGFFVCGFIILLTFSMNLIGGGDVKLIAMMGAFLGVRSGIEAMLWTFVLGAVLAASLLIWQIGVLKIISGVFRHLFLVLRAKSWIPLTKDERAPLKTGLFLAPAGFIAVVVVGWKSLSQWF